MTDLAAHHDRVVEPPPGLAWRLFARDGVTLAASAGRPRADDPPVRLVLVDATTGGVLEVPGSPVPTGEPVGAAVWSASSEWVFFSGPGDGMRVYGRGAPAAARLPLPSSYTFAAT